MTKITKCYAKKFKKTKLCRIKQNNTEIFMQFNGIIATMFMVAIFYTQNQEKGGIQCQMLTKL